MSEVAPCEECQKSRRVAAVAGYAIGLVAGGAIVFMYLRTKAAVPE